MNEPRPSQVAEKARGALEALRRRAVRDRSGSGPGSASLDELRAAHEDLERRFRELESLVEGLQDAVHRESVRHDERIEALERKTEPEEIARALSDDARRRGL